MPWLKVSDRFMTHPVWARVRTARQADDRTVNEVAGFVTRLATQASGHMTDYVLDLETAEMVGKARTQLLLRQAVQAGLLQVKGKGAERTWEIVEDEDLWQMRARDDVAWERQRNRDRRNPELTMPVRARDGDVCRYCEVVVQWSDTRSGRGGTYDHREPGQPATVETYVVACRTCNSKRKDNPAADLELPLLPPPRLPYFSARSKSLETLEAYFGRPIPHVPRPGTQPDAASTPRPGTQPDTAPTRPATPADTASTPRPGTQPDTAPTRPADPADNASTPRPGSQPDTASTPPPAWGDDPPPPPPWAQPPDRTGITAVSGWTTRSGRDGTGQAGPGQVGSGGPPAPTRSRRGRRGKRS